MRTKATAPPWTMRGAVPAALLSAADSLWSDEEIEAATSICGDSVNGLLTDATRTRAQGGLMSRPSSWIRARSARQ